MKMKTLTSAGGPPGPFGDGSAGKHKKRPRALFACAAALVLLVPAIVVSTLAGTPATAASVSVFANAVPRTPIDQDRASVELGAKFSASVDGTISAIRYYKVQSGKASNVATLWDATGNALSRARLASATTAGPGWETVTLKTPINISAGRTYTASYLAPNGAYAADEHGLDTAKVKGQLTVPAGGGVYAYGTGGKMPTQNYLNSNYYVDIVFTPSNASSTPTGTPS
ncbi:hypothetical protein B5P43_23215, partial [Bacillus sp. SRB_336]